MPITKVTRLAIFDELRARNTVWHGRLSQADFLERLYPLDELPSNDSRCDNARTDIIMHTVRWPEDWEDTWVYGDDRFELMQNDEKLLAFLAEMLHPLVRPDGNEVRELLTFINKRLVPDGYHLVEVEHISGRPIFHARPCANPYVAPATRVVQVLESGYVQRQITRMQNAIEREPESAIGTAKDCLETVCKTILGELGSHPADDEVPGLVRATLDSVGIDVAGTPDPARTEKAVKRLLGNLSGLGSAVAEVRNACGTGHGHHASTADVASMYARLVVNATATLVTFIIDRYQVLRAARDE